MTNSSDRAACTGANRSISSSDPIGLMSRLARFVRRFRCDSSGIAAIEFGYLAPILLMMFICTIELGRMIAIDRRFSLATALVADLVTREKAISAVDLKGQDGEQNGGIYGIVKHVMSPFDTTTLKIAITPVQANPDDPDDIRVYAETTNRPPLHNATNRAKGDAFTLDSGLIAPGASAIVVETSYEYEPLFLDFLTSVMGWSNFQWTDLQVMSPRENCVDFDNNKCVTSIF